MESDPAKMEANVYRVFEATVTAMFGSDTDSKRNVQKLAEGLPPALRDPGFIATLFECFASERWHSPSSDARSNWLWRAEGTEHSDTRAEVRLERAVVDRGGSATWSFQMSTMSGLFEPGSHQRRAIDLVHRFEPDAYALIELKIGSNTPVFAAFEILGYGLAYCQARRFADVHSPSSTYDVMRARQIRLVVLAPTSWYQFNLRGAPKQFFRLTDLSAAFNGGLEHLRRKLALRGLDAFTFEFRRFDDEPGLLKQVGDEKWGGALLVH